MILGCLLILGMVGTAGFAAPKTVKIGVICPVTGPSSTFGTGVKDAIAIAEDKLKASGGINGMQVEFIVLDDRANPAEAVAAAERLIHREGVSVLLVPVMSSVVLAVMEVAEANQIPLVTSGATAESITQKGYKYIFRTCATNATQASTMVPYVMERFSPKTAAIIYENSDYGVSLKDNTTAALNAAGVKVVGTEHYMRESVDFRTQLTKLRAQKPDVLFMASITAEAVQIMRQRKELGWNDVKLVAFNGIGADTVQLAGDAAEGLLFISGFEANLPDPVVQGFASDWQKKYNKPINPTGAAAYNAILVILDSIGRGGSTPKGIRDAIAATKGFHGMGVEISFSPSGQAESSWIVIEVVKGERVIRKW
jgi:branched-chain amino acid transport system substrate-binding protein